MADDPKKKAIDTLYGLAKRGAAPVGKAVKAGAGVAKSLEERAERAAGMRSTRLEERIEKGGSRSRPTNLKPKSPSGVVQTTMRKAKRSVENVGRAVGTGGGTGGGGQKKMK